MLLRNLSNRFKQLTTNHPKGVFIGMMLFLLLGVVMIFVKRHSIRNTSRIDKIGNVIKNLPETDTIVARPNLFDEAANVMEMNEHLDEVQEILRLEEEVNRVLKKEVLTKDDSLFLNEINKKLNKLNYEN